MIAQRMRHGGAFDESDKLTPHTAEFVHGIFDEELEKLLADKNRKDEGTDETIRKAREIAEAMVMNEEFTPI
jgi:hypothetical protein